MNGQLQVSSFRTIAMCQASPLLAVPHFCPQAVLFSPACSRVLPGFLKLLCGPGVGQLSRPSPCEAHFSPQTRVLPPCPSCQSPPPLCLQPALPQLLQNLPARSWQGAWGRRTLKANVQRNMSPSASPPQSSEAQRRETVGVVFCDPKPLGRC